MKCPKNVEDFGGAPENDERNYGQGWRPRIEITTAWDNLQVCVMVIPKEWNALL